MKDYTLSRERIAELEKFHRSVRDKPQADHVKAVILYKPYVTLLEDMKKLNNEVYALIDYFDSK